MFDVLPEIPVTDVSEFEYYYNSDYEGIYVTKYTGSSLRVRVPDTIDGEPVVSVNIGNKAITQLIVPETVYWIKCNKDSLKYANIPAAYSSYATYTSFDREPGFRHAPNLEKVYFSKDIKYIGKHIFRLCPSLTEVLIPDGVTEVKRDAFDYAKKLTVVYKGKQYTDEKMYEFYNAVNGTNYIPDEGVGAPAAPVKNQ